MKTIGHYTATATKAIKNGSAIICNKAEDGAIYVSNAFFIYKMTAPEYDAFIRSATKCDPGNWQINTNGERQELQPGQCNIIKIFADALAGLNKATTATACSRCPLEYEHEKTTAISFYNAATGLACFYNKLFIDGMACGTLHATTATGAAIVMQDGDAFAMVLPIRPDAAKIRAVKAYFAEATDAENSNDENAEKLRRSEAMRAALVNKIAELDDEITRRNNEIAALQQQNEQQAEQLRQIQHDANDAKRNETAKPAADPKTAAEVIKAKFEQLAGVVAVIKGEKTAAPVVWLAGDIAAHKKAIIAAGAKWSQKRGAYYIKIA